jgi:hypothetical protein
MRMDLVGATTRIALVILLTAGAAASQGVAQADRDATWAACVMASKRGCVVDEALALAQSIKHERGRDIALSAVAEAQAKAGRLDDALQLSRSIKGERERATALAALAGAQAKAGGTTEALQLARSIKDEGTPSCSALSPSARRRRASRRRRSPFSMSAAERGGDEEGSRHVQRGPISSLVDQGRNRARHCAQPHR